jgi:hypothetical protein
MTRVVRALCFPAEDAAFRAHAISLMDRVAFMAANEGTDRADALAATVQALLRERYPRAVIWSHPEHGSLGERQVWHMYRVGPANVGRLS